MELEVKLLDLKAQYNGIRDEIEQAVSEVIESQYFILGPKVQELEEKIAGLEKNIRQYNMAIKI